MIIPYKNSIEYNFTDLGKIIIAKVIDVDNIKNNLIKIKLTDIKVPIRLKEDGSLTSLCGFSVKDIKNVGDEIEVDPKFFREWTIISNQKSIYRRLMILRYKL